MSYWAVGHGSLVLRVDKDAVSGLRTSMSAYYDKRCLDAQKSVSGDSQKRTISLKYQAEKQMLEDPDPSK